jgi:hypothetical protein
MRQLQLFTPAELSRMRDRTASRNHSPERDEFRRVHAHHRAWGLVQRHGRRRRHLRNSPCTPRPASTPDNGQQDSAPAPAPAPAAAAAAAVVPVPAVASDLAPAVPPEQRKRSAPAVFAQRRSPARNQPARNQRVSASPKPSPAPHTGPAVPPARPSRRAPPHAGHGTVGTPDEDPHAVAWGPDRTAPEASPPTASHESDGNAEVGWPIAGPPRHRHRQSWKMVAGVVIHAPPKSIACHPFIAPGRSAEARSP